MQQHLAKKLKVNLDLPALLEYEKEVQATKDPEDSKWVAMINSEKEKLKRRRTMQERELERIIDDTIQDEFQVQDANVAMMTSDLKEKFKKQRLSEENKGEAQYKYIITVNNPFRKFWEKFIIVVAIYSVVVIPMKLRVVDTILGDYYLSIDVFTYILYVADVAINLRSTYINSFGEEIMHPRRVMLHYVSSFGFWVDLASLLAIPKDDLPESLTLFGMLKIGRVLRISSLITQMNSEKSTKIVMQIVYYYLIFIIYLHITACLWFFIIDMNRKAALADENNTTI